MKTIQVAISIIFLALSGCAHTGYQQGYAGYGGGYTAQRYYEYDGYDRSYYSPGTSFIYERSYVQPRFSHPHHEHERFQDRHRHRDWQAPIRPSMHQPRHFDGGHGDWSHRRDRDRDMDHMDRKFVPSQRNAEHAPNWAVQRQHQEPSRDQHRNPEQHRQDFGGHRRHGDGDRRGRDDGHYR